MKRFFGVILVLVAVLALGGFAPASATSGDVTVVPAPTPVPRPLDGIDVATAPDQIPFNVPVKVNGVTQPINTGTGTDTGFVGVCDVELQCVGLSTSAFATDGYVKVTDTTVNVRGVVCVRSFRAPCGTATQAGTGVFIEERSYDLPEGEVKRPEVGFETCSWVLDPRFEPGTCVTDDISAALIRLAPETSTVSVPDAGVVSRDGDDFIPNQIIIPTP